MVQAILAVLLWPRSRAEKGGYRLNEVPAETKEGGSNGLKTS
jgi:hypothetical protein